MIKNSFILKIHFTVVVVETPCSNTPIAKLVTALFKLVDAAGVNVPLDAMGYAPKISNVLVPFFNSGSTPLSLTGIIL